MRTSLFPILIVAAISFLMCSVACTRPPEEINKLQALEILPRPDNFSLDSAEAFDIYHRAEIYAYFYKLDSALLLSLESIDRFSKLTRHTRDSLTWTYLIDAYFNSGYIYGLQNKCDSSILLLQKSLDLCKQIFTEDHLIATKCMIKLANCYITYGNYNLAKEYYYKSYEIRVRTLDSLNAFLINGNGVMSAYCYSIGDFDKAKIFGARANALISRIYDHFYVQNTDMPDELFYKQYLNYHVRPPAVKNLFLSNIPRQYIFSTIRTAASYLENDEPEKAIHFIELGDSLIKKHEPSNLRLWSDLLGVKASIYLYNQQTDKAAELIDSFKLILKSSDFNLNRSFLSYKIADYYSLIHNYQESINTINTILSEGKKLNSGDLYGFSALKARQLYLSSNYEECITFCQEFLKSRFNISMDDSIDARNVSWDKFTLQEIIRIQDYLRPGLRSLVALARSSGSLEQLLLGYRLLQVFDASMDFLQGGIYNVQTKSIRLKMLYPFYEDALELCYLLYEKTSDDRYAKEVFRLSDLVKSFQIKEILNQQNMNAFGNESREKVKTEELQIEISAIRDQILEAKRLNKPDSLRLFNLTKSLSELTGQLALLLEKNSDPVKSPENHIRYHEFPMQQLVEHMKNGKADLIDYFLSKDHIYLLVINANGFKLIREKLQPKSKILAENFIQTIKNHPGKMRADSLEVWAVELYDLLLRPVKYHLQAPNLIVVPDDWISYLPFEYLSNAGENNISLSLNQTIRYEYASTLPLNKRPVTQHAGDYAGFAPHYSNQEIMHHRGLDSVITYPVYSANRNTIGALLFNEPEVREASRLLNGEAYSGNLVNKELFIQKSAKARILHLAMHALTDDKHPEYSQLVFKNKNNAETSESMYAYELARMKLNADLSVLSACNSGSGKFQKGEGVLSLARAFKASGCPNIIMSLWPANDASTKDIVVGFFKHLKAGMGKADALRQSKQDYLGLATDELKHPYYWAGLVLIGDNEPMKFGSSLLPLILLVFIALFIAGLFYLRSKKWSL